MTGNYPGKARTPDELRSDLEQAYSLIPGKHRLNLHASYGEFAVPVDRDQIGIEQFQGWIDWDVSTELRWILILRTLHTRRLPMASRYRTLIQVSEDFGWITVSLVGKLPQAWGRRKAPLPSSTSGSQTVTKIFP